MEDLFGSLERERVSRRMYRTRVEAGADVFDYLERVQGRRRQLNRRIYS